MPGFAVDPGMRACTISGARKRPRRSTGIAGVDGDLNHRDASGVRGPPQAEQQRPRPRVPSKAFDVEPARVGLSLADGGERRHVAQQPVAKSGHHFGSQVTVGSVAHSHQPV